ncbi:MAG: G5 domain-containing protein [Oscillospiraceae bacterium]|nr:G5 domain-containing protein [Oscillospiraceae bacterium]
MKAIQSAIARQTPAQWIARMLILAIIVSVTAVFMVQPAAAMNNYRIRDGYKVILHSSDSTDPETVLQEAGLELGKDDRFTARANGNGETEISVERLQLVTVRCDGKTYTVGTYGETVGSILQGLGITLSGDDYASYYNEAPTHNGMAVDVYRVTHETVTYDEVLPCGTTCYEDPTLPLGDVRLLAAGVNGSVRRTAYVTYENGREVKREILSEMVQKYPVKEIVLGNIDHSLKPQENSGSVTATVTQSSRYQDTQLSLQSTGEPNNGRQTLYPEVEIAGAARTLTCLGTAYSCDGRPGITATGTTVHIGTVAVDPKVIPLGSKMYIVSNDGRYVYGFCTAEDTGGLIKGNRVDLYFNTTEECFQFGARPVTVYILES